VVNAVKASALRPKDSSLVLSCKQPSQSSGNPRGQSGQEIQPDQVRPERQAQIEEIEKVRLDLLISQYLGIH